MSSELRFTFTTNILLYWYPWLKSRLTGFREWWNLRDASSEAPRHVLCHIYYYHQKEEIQRKAWAKRSVDFDEATITFSPDLPRHILYTRRQMKPLL